MMTPTTTTTITLSSSAASSSTSTCPRPPIIIQDDMDDDAGSASSVPLTPASPGGTTASASTTCNDDAVSLKSWFETNFTSAASRFASRFNFPILLGSSMDAEPAGPVYDVFLGGSCGHTVWRSEIVIPYLKKRAITYYDPQRPTWSEQMIYEEALAKENSRLFLFVLDPGTINATSFLEIAYFAARKAPKLVVVFLGRREWSDKAHPCDLPDRIRTCNLLEAILKRHSVPMLTSITEALDYVDAMIIGTKSVTTVMREPLQRLPYLQIKTAALAKSSVKAVYETYEYCKSSMGLITCKAASAVIIEVIILCLLHFFILPDVSIWLLVIPTLAIDYLLVVISLIYFRFAARRRRLRALRKVVLPTPPIPRIGKSSVPDHARGSCNPTPSTSFHCLEKPCELIRRRGSADLESQYNSTDGAYCSRSPSTPSSGEVPAGPRNNGDKESCIVDKEVRCHYTEQQQLHPTSKKMTVAQKMETNGCVTSPIGYDVFLSCSSGSELDWITQKAVPQMHKSGLSYTSALMCDKNMRIPLLHTASHILYYIPSYKTFLSGMIEIAYFIGHSDWQVTVCVPREAECLVLLDDSQHDPETVAAVERRNESYRMAFCYLKDMAQRRQCRVFTRVEEAIQYISGQTARQRGSSSEKSDKKAVLRQVVEKQHLVNEGMQDDYLLSRSVSPTTSLSSSNA